MMDAGLAEEILRQIGDTIELHRYLQREAAKIEAIAGAIATSFKSGNKILLCGNGGSAADAQHIAAELAGKFYQQRRPLPAVALTTNSSVVTAIANDFGYDDVFARQVTGLAKKGDVVLGISTSGESPNVIKAIEEAKRQGAVTIAFTGQGGVLTTLADFVLSVPSKDTPRIQEAHITAGHIMCYLVERAIVEEDNGRQGSSLPR
jgi:D-sedoheptulose 7-phosphate isomerase